MCGKSCEDKRECDLRGKGVEDKGDADLGTCCESRDEMVRGFVFEKEDKDGGGVENSVVFDGGIAGRGGDNSVLLICQYQVILGSIIIQTFLNESCWASS